MLHQLGSAVYKRAVSDNTTNLELPSWTPLVILLNLIIFVPIWIFVSLLFRPSSDGFHPQPSMYSY